MRLDTCIFSLRTFPKWLYPQTLPPAGNPHPYLGSGPLNFAWQVRGAEPPCAAASLPFPEDWGARQLWCGLTAGVSPLGCVCSCPRPIFLLGCLTASQEDSQRRESGLPWPKSGCGGVADGNMNELLKDLVRAQGRCISPGLVAGNALGPWAVGAGGGIPGES